MIRYHSAKHESKFRRMRALTLVELLVCLGIMSVVLGVGGLCFAQVVRLRGAQERYNYRLDATDYLLRQVAKDVRAARGFAVSVASAAKAASADEFKSDNRTLILRMADGHVIYQHNEAGVERIALFKDRAHRIAAMAAVGVSVRFDFEGLSPNEARSVVTTAEWDEPPKIGISHPMLSLRVACRNYSAR
ncbi:MAG: prepilin-type N-terminal cleavage/methylation domain-containing protein [Pseudomonadota bacterium]